MFSYFAHDKDGFIGFEEMKTMFISLGEKVADSEISKMIIIADKNKDRRLDLT
jgi:Ca2+-binding EF-hand superfamily protein